MAQDEGVEETGDDHMEGIYSEPDEPVPGPSRYYSPSREESGTALSAMGILRAPSDVNTLLSPLNLGQGRRPEHLEGFVRDCYDHVDEIYYVSTLLCLVGP